MDFENTSSCQYKGQITYKCAGKKAWFVQHDVRASEIWGVFLWDDPDQVVTEDLYDHPPWERIIHPSDLVLLILIRIIPQIRNLTIPLRRLNVTEKSTSGR